MFAQKKRYTCIIKVVQYGTARFKLDRKLRCVSFHSRLALRVHANLLAQKILVGRFCVNTRVPIKTPYVCLSVCSKTIQHESTYARDFPCKLCEKYPTTCNQALLQMYAHSFILTAPVLNKEQ